MNWLNSVAKWFVGIGDFLHAFTNTPMGRFMKKYGPVAIQIVAEVALFGGTGKEKRQRAISLLIAKIPDMVVDEDYASGTIKSAYEIWKSRQETIDTDEDGVPDYRDLCKNLGKQLSGCVDENGCPDMDCNGLPDKDDERLNLSLNK